MVNNTVHCGRATEYHHNHVNTESLGFGGSVYDTKRRGGGKSNKHESSQQHKERSGGNPTVLIMYAWCLEVGTLQVIPLGDEGKVRAVLSNTATYL